MDRIIAMMDIDDEKLEAVLRKLHDAEETIRDCYDELRNMGVVTLRREKKQDAASGN